MNSSTRHNILCFRSRSLLVLLLSLRLQWTAEGLKISKWTDRITHFPIFNYVPSDWVTSWRRRIFHPRENKGTVAVADWQIFHLILIANYSNISKFCGAWREVTQLLQTCIAAITCSVTPPDPGFYYHRNLQFSFHRTLDIYVHYSIVAKFIWKICRSCLQTILAKSSFAGLTKLDKVDNIGERWRPKFETWRGWQPHKSQ